MVFVLYGTDVRGAVDGILDGGAGKPEEGEHQGTGEEEPAFGHSVQEEENQQGQQQGIFRSAASAQELPYGVPHEPQEGDGGQDAAVGKYRQPGGTGFD